MQSKDRTKTLQAANKALGATSTTFTKVDLATDWMIQVAVTDRKKVISDIVEVEFTSGVQKPLFFSGLYWAGPATGGHTTAKPSSGADTSVDKADHKVGDFYYLGFNKYFDNWYVEGAEENYDRNDSGGGGVAAITDDVQPNIAKFRVGLRHGVANPGDADFDHFRIRVEDAGGDNLLGFDAETVVDSAYRHGTKEFALHTTHATATKPAGMIANIALSNRLDNDGRRVAAIYEAPSALGAYRLIDFTIYGLGTGFDPAAVVKAANAATPAPANVAACVTALRTALANTIRLAAKDLSYAQFKTFAPTEANRAQFLYAELPDQIYDLPKDIFRRDGTFTVTAWAEDAKDNQISPRAEIVVNVQERLDEQAALHPIFSANALDNLATLSALQDYHPFNFVDGVRLAAGRCELGIEQQGNNLFNPYPIPVPVGEALVVGLTITKK